MGRTATLWLALLALLGLMAAACAEPVEDEESDAAADNASAEEESSPEEPAEDGEVAADFPSRDIDIMTAFDPGGTTDLVARMAADFLSERWDVGINVVNRPGGNTVPANQELYAAEPDGHTVMSDAIGSSSILPNQLGDDLPFDVMDRTFINVVSSNSMLLVTQPDGPIETLEDAVEQAREDAENFTWAAIGVAELPMRQLLREADVDISETRPVTSDGSQESLVLAGQGSADIGIAAVGPSISPVESGIVHPLAIAADERWPALPDVPTAAEAGFPDVRIISWIGLTGPPGMPDDVVETWNEGVQAMLEEEDVQQQLTEAASEPDYQGPEEFRQEVESQIEEFAELYVDE